jgi:hypothetical protein
VSARRPFAALLDPDPAVRLFPASAVLGGAALAFPQRSSPQISASRVRSMACSSQSYRDMREKEDQKPCSCENTES